MIRILLIAGGIFNLLMAIFHVFFWKFFNWPISLTCLALDNRAIIQTFNLIVILILTFFAAVSFFCIEQLRKTSLGIFVLITISGLWLIRAIAEIVYFGAEWAVLSTVVFILCICVAALYLLPVLPVFRKV